MITGPFGIPDTLTWASVLDQVANFLSEPVIMAALTATIALGFGRRIVRALKGAVVGK